MDMGYEQCPINNKKISPLSQNVGRHMQGFLWLMTFWTLYFCHFPKKILSFDKTEIYRDSYILKTPNRRPVDI
jgi:hypothetical protein